MINVLVIKTLDPDQYGIQPKMLDRNPDQMNTDPKHCYASVGKSVHAFEKGFESVGYYFNVDPDSAFHLNADPDPAPPQSDANLRLLI